MTGPAEFHGVPTGPRGGRAGAAIVALLVVAFIGLAVAKPWDRGAMPPPVPSATRVAEMPSVTPPPALPTTAPPASPDPGFTIATPPAADAQWTMLTWQKLDPAAPLAAVLAAGRAPGGFLALGSQPDDGTSGQAWASIDGRRWEPLAAGTSSTFWPGTRILAMAASVTGFVVIGAVGVTPQVIVWTSSDGRAWTPAAWTGLIVPASLVGLPFIAANRTGLVIAWTDTRDGQPRTHVARSADDGLTWTEVPASRLPAGFGIRDLRAFDDGYLAVGNLAGTHPEPAVLWSSDGETWTRRHLDAPVSSGLGPLVVAAKGVIAIGQLDTMPGATSWWQSGNTVRWREVAAFSPLGPTACLGMGCGTQPDGDLVGDGSRMVAVRGGPDPAAWTSLDGSTWHRCDMNGEVPPIEAGGDIVLLPGGILWSDGIDTWYGTASAAP